MSVINNSLSVSTSNFENEYGFDSCYCNNCNNQTFTDYPSPMSSPNSPELNDTTRNTENAQSNNNPYFSDSYDYCASPSSIITNDDVDIDVDISTTSDGSYTTSYTNANTNNTYCENCSPRKSKKRSFSEVDGSDTCYDVDSMNDEELESYYNNIDLDLYPKVKSPSELLIFSPFVMKRFKLYDHKKSIQDDSNYNTFGYNGLNTPKIVEITDDEESSFTSSDESMPSESSFIPLVNTTHSNSSSQESINTFCSCSPFISSLQQQKSTYYNNADSSFNV